MKNFKKILVLALAVVVCLTVLSVTIFADNFNPTITVSARFDETGDKLIASVITSQPCGAIKGTLTFSNNLTLDNTSFIEKNEDTKYVTNGNTIKFVILADDMENGSTHWADFYFKIDSVADVTFTLSEVDVCDVNETLVSNSQSIKGAAVTLTENELRTLGAQYRAEAEGVKPALRFGTKLERDIANNELSEGKTAVRCGYIAGFEFKVGEGTVLEAKDFNTETGKFTTVTTGAINKQAKYYLSSTDDYLIYTYAITGITDTKEVDGQGLVKDLPIVARPYVVYKNSNGTYGIDYGTQISKCYSEVKAASELISGSGSYGN